MGKKMPAAKINLDGVSKDFRWYSVCTKYNYEQKLAHTIEEGKEKAGCGDKISEVLVPIKVTTEQRVNAAGKVTERTKREKIYPLYIFIKAKMDDHVWNYIKNSDGSSAILAPSGFPVQIEEEDINKIKQHCNLMEREYNDDFTPEVGFDVYIKDGVFKGQYGKVLQVRGNGIIIDVRGLAVKLPIDILEHVIIVD
jgi:transcription antitermination factor NusG